MKSVLFILHSALDVSFGSSVRPREMGEEKMAVFAQVKHTVIWKSDGEEMAGLTSIMKKRIILALAVVFLFILLGSIGLWLGLRGRETQGISVIA